MYEILKFHVESRKITPTIMQRAIKNFVTRFDSNKSYLLQAEIAPFLNLPTSALKKIIRDLEKDDLDTFIGLNQVIQNSIVRSHSYRGELLRELILENVESESFSQESYLHFARSDKELRQRIKKQLARLIHEQQKKTPNWTFERKEKVLSFFAKQASRRENLYKEDGEKQEHYLVVHTLKALANSLDAHTAYYTPQEAADMRASLEKEFRGVGVVLKEDVDGILIARVIERGPAHRSGKVFPGDRLTHINNKSTEELTYEEVLDRLKGDKKVSVWVRHGDGTQDKVNLKKERIELIGERAKHSYVPYGEGLIGKIELPSFYEGSGDSSSEKDIMASLRELKKKGNLLGLILDLRENSGGFLSQAVNVAGLFVRSGVIVVSKYARGEVQYLRDVDPRVYYDGPLVVLTSKASASAAEIVAQALQDYGLALVVGDKRTYGKGSIQYQTLTDPSAKAFFKVTVGRYYTVSGRSTQITGVAADIVVPTPYSAFQIGERHLDYPLSSDHIDPAFVDPLVDVQDGSLRWFQKYYLPNLQKRVSQWRQMIPYLEKNSEKRLAQDVNFQLFLQDLKKEPTKGNWGTEDLQMLEALDILRDMIYLQREKALPKNA